MRRTVAVHHSFISSGGRKEGLQHGLRKSKGRYSHPYRGSPVRPTAAKGFSLGAIASRVIRVLAPLRNPAYRHLFLAQVAALLGTGMATVALGLLAHDLAGASAGQILGAALAIKMVA